MNKQTGQFSNVIRYVPSATYYARLRVKGKLIVRSLKTDVLSVAKLRLGDLEKQERQRAESGQAKGMSQKKSLEKQSSALLKGRADWLEPCPRLQKSSWFGPKTMVANSRILSDW